MKDRKRERDRKREKDRKKSKTAERVRGMKREREKVDESRRAVRRGGGCSDLLEVR